MAATDQPVYRAACQAAACLQDTAGRETAPFALPVFTGKREESEF